MTEPPGLIGGTRVKKYHIRLEAYGTVDELNSWIGLMRSQGIDNQSIETLLSIQGKLFVIGASLATDSSATDFRQELPCNGSDIEQLEKAIDQMEKELPPMNNFILPGGNNPVSFCHIARTVCRRAERHVILLSEESDVEQNITTYLNRLSDYLFVLSRYIAHNQGISETPWILKK